MVAEFVYLDDLYERRGFVCDFLRMSKQKQKIKDEVYRIKGYLRRMSAVNSRVHFVNSVKR